MFKDSRDNRGLRISTFHALGMSMLRSDLKLAGLRSGFSIIDPTDSLKIIGDFHAELFGRNAEIEKKIQYQISHWKNQGVTEQQVPIVIANAEAAYPA